MNTEIKDHSNDGCDDWLNNSYDSIMITTERRCLIPENLIHTLRNTLKEIRENKLIGMTRLIENRCSWGKCFKSEMADYFFPIDVWPIYAIEILLTDRFRYSERIGLACIFHGNERWSED